VVTNHPLASAAGAEMLAAGGNAIDATIAALFTLGVVEPMMVGPLGGGLAHLRFPDGRHTVIDGMSYAPAEARGDMFRPVAEGSLETEGRANVLGALAVAVPGNLRAWCEMLRRFGTMSLADVTEPAIRHASRGFRITAYLSDAIGEASADLALDPGMAARFLPGGARLPAGARLVQGDTAETLQTIARDGEAALYDGPIGVAVADAIRARGGVVSRGDLAGYRTVERAPIRSPYRGWEIVGPPPPASSGVHIPQMLNILEGFGIGAMGFGSVDGMHLLIEALRIAFADRAAFVDVPVARLISKEYAAERRALIDMARAGQYAAGVVAGESAHTTHLTVADRDGHVVAATQTINSTFGARFLVPGVGLIPNNYMSNFDPHPGRAQSVAAGKRIPTSMAPMMALRDGRVVYALGLPGGLRIFPSAMQALVNLIDHGMSLQEAIEAPRLWTQGGVVEVEEAFSGSVLRALRARGHEILTVPHVGGGMNAVQVHGDGTVSGAACWRADGTAVGLGGGLARPGARFWVDGVQKPVG